jgi:hypothetical protein
MPEDRPVVNAADTSRRYLESDRAAQIYSTVTKDASSTVAELTKFVQEHKVQVESLREMSKFMGGLDEAKQAVLTTLETELSNEVVQVVKQILADASDMPTKDAGAIARLGNAAAASGQPKRETGPRDFYERYGVPRPDYDIQRVRADVRVGRSLQGSGQLPEDYGGLKTDVREQLAEHSETLRKGYEEERSKGDAADIRKLEDFSRRIVTTDRLKAEIVNLFELNAQQQRSAWNTALGTISTIFTSLGVSQAISRFAISEPYRFETQPQLQIMGQQGQMGAAMGSAFGELEAYNVELNQMMFGAGVGSTFAGASMLVGGANVWQKAAGGALLAGGLSLGAMGVAGVGDDALRRAGFSTPEDEILGQALAKQFSDPSRLLNEFQVSRAGLLAVGAGSSYNMGYQTEGTRGEGLTGNTYLDQMLTSRTNLYGPQGEALLDEGGNARSVSTLRALGYNRESLGALLSQSALSLRDTGPGLASMGAFAGEVGGLYGIGDEAAISAMQTAQRFGSQDAVGTYKEYAGVFAEEDGDISSYSMSVLVPALLKVTESMAMRNLARTTEELTGEVTTFGRTVIQSETRLGELAKANPEVLGRLLTGLQASASMGMEDPAMAALDMSLGSSFADIFMGRASVADRRMQFVLNQSGLAGQEFGSPDEFLGSMQGIGTMRVLQGLFTGISPQDLLALTELAMEGTLFDEKGAIDMGAMDEDMAKRINALGGSPLAEISSTMSEQVDEFMTTSSGLIDELKTLQESLTGFLGNSHIATIMSDFLAQSSDRVSGLSEGLAERGAEAAERRAVEDAHMRHQASREMNPGEFAELRSGLHETRNYNQFVDALGGTDTAAYWDIMSKGIEDENFREGLTAAISNRDTMNESLRELFGTHGLSVPGFGDTEGEGFSSGGFTGMGGRHQVAGMVHAGEYVISSNNVSNNIDVLNRIQSGETVSESSVSSGQGNVTYLTMKIHGMSPEDIQDTARRVTEDYIVRNRLNYV